MKRYKIRNKRIKFNKENYQVEKMGELDKVKDDLVTYQNDLLSHKNVTKATYISGWQN